MKTQAERHAEAALPAVCGALSFNIVRDENFDMWMGCLRDLLPDCENAPLALADLRFAAENVVFANDVNIRNGAMSNLRRETKAYFARAAGQRIDHWQQAKEGEVVE